MPRKIALETLTKAEEYLAKAAWFEDAARAETDEHDRADLLQIAHCLRHLARSRSER